MLSVIWIRYPTMSLFHGPSYLYTRLVDNIPSTLSWSQGDSATKGDPRKSVKWIDVSATCQNIFELMPTAFLGPSGNCLIPGCFNPPRARLGLQSFLAKRYRRCFTTHTSMAGSSYSLARQDWCHHICIFDRLRLCLEAAEALPCWWHRKCLVDDIEECVSQTTALDLACNYRSHNIMDSGPVWWLYCG